MRSDRYFYGAIPLDKLPAYLPKRPCKIIINLDPAYKPGSHWVAIYIPKMGSAFFMDPLGNAPPPLIAAFLQKNSPHGWKFNKDKLQGDLSVMCGYYCILFVKACPNVNKFYSTFRNCYLNNEKKILNIVQH